MKTILKVAIHPKDANPVFGVGVTHVSIEDEAAGGFILLTQHNERPEGVLAFDIEELEEIWLVAKEMMEAYEKAAGE